MKLKITKNRLEELYNQYNRREFVHPDPLEFLYHYDDIKDREIVGLIASSLAYGRVAQILKSVSSILEKMGKLPYDFLMLKNEYQIRSTFHNFKHRFTTGNDLSNLLMAIKKTLDEYGSIQNVFKFLIDPNDQNIIPAISGFVYHLNNLTESSDLKLLPSPEKGSACKRLNLYLRWMIRKDAVDPGGWDDISAEKLLIPLDTHMYKIGTAFGFSNRKQANLKTAIEITSGFKKFTPQDPTKYDFALTRFGIRDDMEIKNLI